MGKIEKLCEPPLPFAGNKKCWAAELMAEAALLPPGACVRDCFGGSGVCARVIKDARPDCRVVWNDYDGYSERLRHAGDMENLRRTLYRLVGGVDRSTGFARRLSDDERDAVRRAVASHAERFGYYDGALVSRWLSLGFTGKAYDLNSPPAALYAHIPLLPMRVGFAETWCDGLDITRKKLHEQPIAPGDFLILDPPYVGTDCTDYESRETLRVLRYVRELMSKHKFILFGDESVAFLYELMTEKFSPRRIYKDNFVTGRTGRIRKEVMFTNW